MGDDAAPISPAEFAALMERFGPWPGGKIAVAVSGGADSMCLAWLAHRWGTAVGFIIDHGLRQESAEEAATAAGRLAAIGMPASIRRLALSPGPALAARAREARYAALAGMAAAAGIVDLLVGHHARDQAETWLMRQEARSGAAGLAGMAAVTETGSLRIVRPLLGLAPARLRATLEQAGLAWSEDPSNENPAALRTRLRRQLADPGAGETIDALVAAARRHGEARAEREARLAAILADRVSLHAEGFALLTPGPIEADALAAVIRAVTGAPYPPGSDALADLARDPHPATLAGAQILPAGRLGACWLLVREAAAMAPAIAARPGAIWDRRFRLPDSASFDPESTIGAVGPDAAALRHAVAWPAAILRSMPVLRRHGRIVAGPLTPPHVWFCPATPLAGGRFQAW